MHFFFRERELDDKRTERLSLCCSLLFFQVMDHVHVLPKPKKTKSIDGNETNEYKGNRGSLLK